MVLQRERKNVCTVLQGGKGCVCMVLHKKQAVCDRCYRENKICVRCYRENNFCVYGVTEGRKNILCVNGVTDKTCYVCKALQKKRKKTGFVCTVLQNGEKTMSVYVVLRENNVCL